MKEIASTASRRFTEWWDSDHRNPSLHAYFYEYYRGYDAQRVLQEAADYEPLLALKGRVASVGCGYGLIELCLSSKQGDNGTLIGVDTNREKLEDMRVISQSLGTKEVAVAVASATLAPFRDASLDTVFALATMSHVPCDEPLLREAARVLRDRGEVAIIEDANALNPRRYLWCLRIRKDGRWVERPVNPLRLWRILRRNGFRNISVRPYTFKGEMLLRRRRLYMLLERLGTIGLPFAIGFVITAQRHRSLS